MIKFDFCSKFNCLLTCALLYLLFISCQQEEFINEEKSYKSYSSFKNVSSHVSFKDFKTKPAFKVFKKINNSQPRSLTARGGYTDPTFRLELDTTKIIKFESENRHSYTFRIIDTTLGDEQIKNLVLDYREERKGYYAYIFEYKISLTEQEKVLDGESSANIENTTNISIYQPDYTTDSLNDWCFDIIVILGHNCLCGGDHAFGEQCNCTGSDRAVANSVELVPIPCGPGSGGGSTTPGTWNPPSSGGGGGGEPGDYDPPGNPFTQPGDSGSTDDGIAEPVDSFLDGLVTSPVIKDIYVEEPEDDCNTSKEDLIELFPDADDDDMNLLAEMINDFGAEFDIDTVEELQHFLAQAGHESGGFTDLNVTENLNYSAQRLVEVWPSRFSFTDPNKKHPDDYSNDPEALANYVYCCRMGNGDEQSGEGYKFRGRGIFQLTGKNNYEAYHNFLISKDLGWMYSGPSDLENSLHAILSALWFYQENVLNNIDIDSNTSADDVTEYINPFTDENSKNARQDQLDDTESEIECE